MRHIDPASEDDMDDNGMSRYINNPLQCLRVGTIEGKARDY